MVDIIKWQELLKNCKYDNSVGIKIAKLAGNDVFATFITEIDVAKSVNPHYHRHGDEHYHIIQGVGEVYLKDMITLEVVTLHVRASESFVVPENTLHMLSNTGDESLILMFSCPSMHLETDRYFE